MKYLSVCSGVGSDHLAAPDHWQCVGFSEIEAFPSAVLKHHWPEVRNYGDFTTIGGDAVDAVDLLTGGTPCQAFSVAGQRGGLDDPRGELSLEFVRLARRTRARWVVWENVPGVLSSSGGKDFETFIGALVDSGYSVAWRVLDAQWFGVAQRRRRVWVVGYLGDDVGKPARVLFESDSGQGDSASRRQPRQEIAGTLGGGSGNRGYASDTERMTFVPDVVGTLTPKFDGKNYSNTQEVLSESVIALQMAQTGANGSGISADVAYTLDSASTQSQAVLVDGLCWDDDLPVAFGSKGYGKDVGLVPPALRAGTHATAVAVSADGSWWDGGDLASSRTTSAQAQRMPERNRLDVVVQRDVATSLTAKMAKQSSGPSGSEAGHLIVSFTANDDGKDADVVAPTIRAGGHARSHANGGVVPAVVTTVLDERAQAIHQNTRSEVRLSDDIAYALNQGGGTPGQGLPAILHRTIVRRLTPRECERLQGLPDDWTAIPFRGRPVAVDSVRYKAIGNGWAVPVARWIFARLEIEEKRQ